MAFDTFLEIAEVPGESTAAGKEGQIEVLSFSFGASNPVTIGSTSTGAGGGKSSLSDFTIMKKTETSSAKLFQACAAGDHFPKATVTMRKAGGTASGQVDFLKYEFEVVYVSSIQWSGSTGGDDTPTESVSFTFGKVTITYDAQDNTGKSAGSPQIASWNVQTVAKD